MNMNKLPLWEVFDRQGRRICLMRARSENDAILLALHISPRVGVYANLVSLPGSVLAG